MPESEVSPTEPPADASDGATEGVAASPPRSFHGFSHLGHSLLLGCLCALLWASLPLFRHGGSSVQYALLVLGSALSFVPALLIGRLAIPLPPVASAAALGALVCVPLWTALGMLLKTYTHHRQLGGVVFALLALLAAAVVVTLVARLLRIASEFRAARIALGFLCTGSVFALFYLSLPLASLDFATAQLRAGVVDAIVGLGLVYTAVTAPIWDSDSTQLSKLGYAVGGVCCAVGVLLLLQNPDAVVACGNAPAQCGALAWLR
ncbi:MAG: hypothetical protein HRU17_08520 [Polyangiaceae bacterium]|nr:hypothetical protein [Polyangiaceae bacterium]